jgi:hypothetical protein
MQQTHTTAHVTNALLPFLHYFLFGAAYRLCAADWLGIHAGDNHAAARFIAIAYTKGTAGLRRLARLEVRSG